MFKKISRSLELLEPVDAQRLKEHNIFTGQRPIREAHVAMLADEIRKGTFLTGDIGLAVFDDQKYLVNGQHTMEAVARAGKPIEAVVSWYKCETKDDLSALFRRYDNNLSRTLRDVSIFEAKAKGIEWKDRIVQLVVSAASMKTGIYNTPAAKNRKAELISRFIPHGNFLSKVLDPWVQSRHMHRAAVAHAIFETFERDKYCAEIFWDAVKTGANLDADSPEKLLRDWLKDSATRGSGQSVSSRETFSRCITAWNAARKGQKLKILKYNSSAETPVAK